MAEGYAQAVSVLIVNQLVRRVHLDPFEDRLTDGESNIIWRRSRNQRERRRESARVATWAPMLIKRTECDAANLVL